MSTEPTTQPPVPEVVDARGLRCPLPVIRLAAVARDRSSGDVLTVWSTDPAARHDVPAWARMRGHAVVENAVLDDAVVETAGDARPAPADAAPPGAQAAAQESTPSVPDGGTTWAITVRLGG
ncbi:sulfurtransferase TusA family protein [Oerskovia enterophila]|uniref:Sulfurtransferase TusA n=1 Tax=Oerskovia enterophila TaxID=43678 RepID=A0A163T614_9CELL|nr:sulfurtransferase TusA [Oerskovia enterophila]